jgi:hypothetical protein
MLLTLLHETIAKRAKTVADLQKMLDVAGIDGLEAIDASTVKVTNDNTLKLDKLVTPGTLPFSFAKGEVARLIIELGTLTTLKGFENLEAGELKIGHATKQATGYDSSSVPNKLASFKHSPKVLHKLNVVNCPELTSLVGLQLVGDKVEVQLTAMPKLQTLEGLEGATEISLSSCNNVSFKNFPKTCKKLDIKYNKLTRGIPWFVMIPKTCGIKCDRERTFGEDFPIELYNEIVKLQEEGSATRRDVLTIQQKLIDAGFDDMAKM